MAYDSLLGKTGEYVKDREKFTEEYELFSEEAERVVQMEAGVEKLDEDLQEPLREVQYAFDAEQESFQNRENELEERKKALTDTIGQELEKMNHAREKLDALSGRKYAGGVGKASETCRNCIGQLEEMLDQIGVSLGYGSKRASSADYLPNAGKGIFDGDRTDFPYISNADTGTIGNLRPSRTMPRDLPDTQYKFMVGANGEKTYDSPVEMGKYLYVSQGSAYKNFQGTCGLCSVANVMRLAGVNLSEKDVIDYAANASASDNMGNRKIPWASRLCVVNPLDPGASGGTNARSRQAILEHFGISSGVFPVKMDGTAASEETLEDIANYVAEGKGVIISVHGSVLEPNLYVNDLNSDFHAVTVTSVTRNKYGDVSGFYICDSNKGTTFYPAARVQEALTGADMNVTHTHIR